MSDQKPHGIDWATVAKSIEQAERGELLTHEQVVEGLQHGELQ